jgi:geranylgeranyl diphosphate synthase type II
MGMSEILPHQNLIQETLSGLKLNKKPAELYQPIDYILSLGGKRLRPLLVLMCCDMYGIPPEKVIHPAIGLEVFHNFTLLHDDIMDNAPLRRGKPTVHEKWNANIAILSGDTMYVLAYQQMMQVEGRHLRSVLNLFNETAVKVCEGQQLDMNFEKRNNVSIPEYLQMISLKTAELLACCLKTGAILCDSSVADADALYAFGKNIGLAFQLQDDILDVYGNAGFGKQVGGDIVSNKKTFLLLKAFEMANAYTKESLYNWMNAPAEAAEEKIKGVTEIYNFLNIKSLAEQEMDKYFQNGLQHLEKVIPNSELGNKGKERLRDFAQSLMARTI